MASAMSVAPVHLVKRVWQRIAPLQLAERSWDNVGIIIESPFPRLANKQVLLTIDLTTDVCNEALDLPSCSLVISYHPPVFRALKSMTMADPLQASLLKLSARGISVFTPHTSLDAIPNGINTWLLNPFLGDDRTSSAITPSEPLEGFEGAGMGRIAELKTAKTLSQAVKLVKEHLKLDHVQVASSHGMEDAAIKTVAVCAGSGGSVLCETKADLLITGEMSHHEVLAFIAKGQSVILCKHSNTERPYLSQILQPSLEKELNSEKGESGWQVLVSKKDADPLRTV